MPGSLSRNITDDQVSVSCDDRHIGSRGAPPCFTCLGSLAKTDAMDFRTGGRLIDGNVCTQVRKTHWVGDVGLRLSERDEFRDFSALAPGGFRLMPATGHCRQLGCASKPTHSRIASNDLKNQCSVPVSSLSDPRPQNLLCTTRNPTSKPPTSTSKTPTIPANP